MQHELSQSPASLGATSPSLPAPVTPDGLNVVLTNKTSVMPQTPPTLVNSNSVTPPRNNPHSITPADIGRMLGKEKNKALIDGKLVGPTTYNNKMCLLQHTDSNSSAYLCCPTEVYPTDTNEHQVTY